MANELVRFEGGEYGMAMNLGEALLSILKAAKDGTEAAAGDISMSALIIGFLAAFISGCIACKWMISIVKKGKLVYFGIYCAIVGCIILGSSLL